MSMKQLSGTFDKSMEKIADEFTAVILETVSDLLHLLCSTMGPQVLLGLGWRSEP
jgi:hypothetical protein